MVKKQLVVFIVSIYVGNHECLSFFENSTSQHNDQLDDSEGINIVFGNKKTIPSNHTKFEHCRSVKIDSNGYMTCDCGFVHMYMAPCIHIMATLDNADYLIPELYHIRWWKTYNYYYDASFTPPTLQDTLHDVFTETKNNSFHPNGLYKGCNINNTGFLNQRFHLPSHELIHRQTLKAVCEYIQYYGYLKRDSKAYSVFLESQQDNTSEVDTTTFIVDGCEVMKHIASSQGIICGMGQNSLTKGHKTSYSQSLSQDDDIITMEQFIHTTTRNDFLSACESLYDAALNVNSVETVMDTIISKTAELNDQNSVLSNTDTGSMIMMNGFEGDGRKSNGKRLKRKAELDKNRRQSKGVFKRGDLNNTTGNF